MPRRCWAEKLGDCNGGSLCVPTSSNKDTFTPIPGLKVCVAHCDPESTSPCGPGVTCVYDTQNKDLDCMSSGNIMPGGLCFYTGDCAKGLVCVPGFPTGTCEQWCHPAGTDPPGCPAAKKHCLSSSISVDYEGSTYGVCSP